MKNISEERLARYMGAAVKIDLGGIADLLPQIRETLKAQIDGRKLGNGKDPLDKGHLQGLVTGLDGAQAAVLELIRRKEHQND